MNRIRRLASFVLALCFLCTSMSITSFAASNEPTRDPEVLAPDIGPLPEPRDNYLLLDHEPFTSRYGIDWVQPSGFNSYKVWIQNNTKYTMYLTLTYEGMDEDVEPMTAALAPHEADVVFVVNNAWAVEHSIDARVSDGNVQGIVSVRVAGTKQSW